VKGGVEYGVFKGGTKTNVGGTRCQKRVQGSCWWAGVEKVKSLCYF
jgi:hypothetical protein